MPEFNKIGIRDSVAKIGTHIEILANGKFAINGWTIPEEHRHWFFANFGKTPISKRGLSQHHYDIHIGFSKYTCRYNPKTETQVFLKDGKMHAKNAPAKRTKDYMVFMENGELHRKDGPAIDTGGFKTDVYALNGKIVDYTNFVINSPLSKQTVLFGRKQSKINVSTLNDQKVIQIGNHKWFLEKRPAALQIKSPGISQAIIRSMYKDFPDYEMISYQAPDFTFRKIQDLLNEIAKRGPFADLRTSTNLTTGKAKFTGSLKENGITNFELVLEPAENTARLTLTNEFGNEDILNARLDGIIEAGDDVTELDIDYGELDKILEDLYPTKTKTPEVYRLFGCEVSEKHYKTAQFSEETHSYFWQDDKQLLHSPDADHPALIYSDGNVEYYDHGYLHNEKGPAIFNVKNPGIKEFWIHGRELSLDEFIHYVAKEKAVVFTQKGLRHRTDGPAVIKFEKIQEAHTSREEYWENGFKKPNPVYDNTIPVDLTENSTATTITIDPNQEPVWSNGTTTGNVSIGDGWTIITEEVFPEDNVMATDKLERGQPDLSGSRVSQIWEGGVFGFKRGLVNTSTRLAAEKIVEMAPIEEHEEVAAKLVQIILLMLSAEAINYIPDTMAEKIKLDYETQQEAVSFLRTTCGENIGRDLLNLSASILPHVKDLLVNWSAEEITEFTTEVKKQTAETTEEAISFEDLINDQSQEEQVEEEQEVEYVK
jgi:hypothetical protein